MKPETQEFLESLDEQDIDHIKRALKTYAAVETLGTWLRWIALSGLALAVGLQQFGDSFKKIMSWYR